MNTWCDNNLQPRSNKLNSSGKDRSLPIKKHVRYKTWLDSNKNSESGREKQQQKLPDKNRSA